MLADRDRLEQALENLLANAVRHSPKGVNVLLSISRRGEKVHIDVVDQGPGVSPDAMSRLFQRFARGKESKGLGLGLYFAREIVRAHGGDVAVESSPGMGARFTLVLPIGRYD